MQSKQLLIAIAAFAVTTTGASAYGGKLLNQADLTDDQLAALEVAKELRAEGDRDAARDLLIEAGFDEEALQKMRRAHKHHKAHHKSKRAAILAELSDEEREAFEVAKQANDREAARAILDEAGVLPDRH